MTLLAAGNLFVSPTEILLLLLFRVLGTLPIVLDRRAGDTAAISLNVEDLREEAGDHGGLCGETSFDLSNYESTRNGHELYHKIVI